jgi:hypothetical protein
LIYDYFASHTYTDTWKLLTVNHCWRYCANVPFVIEQTIYNSKTNLSNIIPLKIHIIVSVYMPTV